VELDEPHADERIGNRLLGTEPPEPEQKTHCAIGGERCCQEGRNRLLRRDRQCTLVALAPIPLPENVVERLTHCSPGYAQGAMSVLDTLGRPIRDLRISVTDRCNFRCQYCMPRSVFGHEYRFMDRAELLTFEELERVVRASVAHGVEKVRITGGEPLLRRDLERLIAALAAIPGLDLALTTNASLLARKAQTLKDAGLTRVNVSLDSVDDATFRLMNDADFAVAAVLDGIEAAASVGLPVKVNAVVKRGVNDQGLVEMARQFRGTPHVLRFIEYMDVGATNGWKLDDVVPASEIVARISDAFPLEPIDPAYRGEVARRWRYVDGEGEIGVISSVTQPFCGDCTRARISAEGKLFTCLFAVRGTDLRALLRGGATDEELVAALGRVWAERTDRYSEIRSEGTPDLRRIEMSYIGG
jgi:GTP 3',8-cyclase